MALPQMFLIALAVTGVSWILFLAGFASKVWFEFSNSTVVSFGLWQICIESACGAIVDTFAQMYVARLFCCVALILLVVSAVFLLMFGYKDARKIYATVSYCCLESAGILNFFASVSMMSRVGAFAASVGWGAILVLVAGIMQIVASLFIIIPVRRGQVEYITT